MAKMVRIIRVLEYVGDEDWWNKVRTQSLVHGEKRFPNGAVIRELSVTSAPTSENDARIATLEERDFWRSKLKKLAETERP